MNKAVSPDLACSVMVSMRLAAATDLPRRGLKSPRENILLRPNDLRGLRATIQDRDRRHWQAQSDAFQKMATRQGWSHDA
jgi:hypothetical protein